jgi:arylsulfatase A-like enzyme
MPRWKTTSHLALLLLWAIPARADDPPRPHIVFILADDLGRSDCGFMGGAQIPTPNLDRLANAGTRLDAFYVQPVCSPTRAALMTGRYPMRHGLQVGVVRPWATGGLPLAERTLPQALREAGYTTAIVGKWHLGHARSDFLPTRRGFDRQYGHYNGAIDYFTHTRDGGHDWHRNDAENHDEGYSTELLAREAAWLIQQHGGKQPLFLYVPFNAVHGPFQAPQRHLDRFPLLTGQRKVYAAMLSALDEAVGQIVRAVDDAGIRSNTLFIFSSDNGGPRPGELTDNSPFRAGKGTYYEGGVRVAAFATWDGVIPAGAVLTEPLHMVDWYPTLLALAGGSIEQPLPLDGLDLWPTLTQGRPSPHDDILINTAPDGGAIRRGPWKLILKETAAAEPGKAAAKKTTRQITELYHLGRDPSERTNVASRQPRVVDDLRKRLDAYARQAAPPQDRPMPRGFAVPRIWGEFPNEEARAKMGVAR